MQSVRLEAAPKGGPADPEMPGGLRQLPPVRIQSLDDSLLLSRRQRRRPGDAGNEHGLAQLHRADPESPEPSTERRQTGLEIGGALGQIPVPQGLAGGVVGVQDPAFPVEYDDPLAEPVEHGLGERRKDRGQLVERDSLCHATRYGFEA